MTYLAIIGAVTLVWYFRRVWLTPWARYVSHTCVKSDMVKLGSITTKVGKPEIVGYFLTVKHVTGWPPFLDREATYYRDTDGGWACTETGYVPGHAEKFACGCLRIGKQINLDGIITAALARDIETQELIK